MEDQTIDKGTGPGEQLDPVLVRASTTLIRYPRFLELQKAIRQCQELSANADEPQCMSLEGASGAGKSTLVRDYAAAFPCREIGNATIIPVLYVDTPCPVTLKGLAAEMLSALRAPTPGKGSPESMKVRLKEFIHERQVELVILDDIHYLIDSMTNHLLVKVVEWIKGLIKSTGKPFLVVGLDGTVGRILDLDPQLSRLFAARERLEPFAWDETRMETVHDFSLFIQCAEHASGMTLAEELPRQDTLRRLHYATGGVVGNLMNLLREAVLETREQGRDKLDLATLAMAFEKRLARYIKKDVNPFVGQLDTEFVPPERARRNRLEAIERCSRRRLKRRPTIEEVLTR